MGTARTDRKERALAEQGPAAARTIPSRRMPEGAERGIPVRINMALAVLLAVESVVVLFVVPAVVPRYPFALLAVMLLVLQTNMLWALLHDAIHGVAHPDRRTNLWFGRLLSILFGSPFDAIRLGHLLHHRFNNRPIERPDVIFSREDGLGTWLAHYFSLAGGVYLKAFAATFLVLCPRPARLFAKVAAGEDAEHVALRRACDRGLFKPEPLARARVDACLIVLFLVAGFFCYGERWYVLALALVGRALTLSFYDNAYHYGATLDDPQGAHDLKTSRLRSWLLLHFNYHHVHHRRPSVPWIRLPALFVQDCGVYGGSLTRTALAQLRGPIRRESLPTHDTEREPT